MGEMRTDMVYRVQTNTNELRKTERQIMAEEQRNMRQLEKVEHMHKALAEDTQTGKQSLEQIERMKERTNANFELMEKENQEERKKLEGQLKQLEGTFQQMQSELGQVRSDNAKLAGQVQQARKLDADNLGNNN